MEVVTRKESRGAVTRDRIIQEAVQIFSLKGFYNTSLDDILQATGLSKGGFFCHFKSKEELGFAALDKAVDMWVENVMPLVHSKKTPLEKLLALIDGQCHLAESKTFKGGCIFMSLATEMDDQHELFREKLKTIYDNWKKLIMDVIEDGKAQGAFHKSNQPEELAYLIIATIEGSILLAKINRNAKVFFETMDHLKKLVIATMEA